MVLQLYQRQNGQSVTNTVQGLGEIYREAGPLKGPDQVLEVCASKKVLVINNPLRDTRFLSPVAGSSQPLEMLVVAPLGLGRIDGIPLPNF